MIDFGIVLAVEALAPDDKKNGADKSEPADWLFFYNFNFAPQVVSRYYPIGTKQNVNKNDKKLHTGDFGGR